MTRSSNRVIPSAAPALTALERMTLRLEHLNEIARLFASFETVDQTFDAALAVAARTLPLASAILIEDDGANLQMYCWSPQGRQPCAAPEAKEHAESTFAWLRGASTRGRRLNDHAGMTDLPRAAAGPGAAGNPRFIVLPLVVANRPVFGAIQMEATAFDLLDLAFVNAIASQLSVALDRDRARRGDVARRIQAEAMESEMREQSLALIAADRQRSEFLTVLADELRASLATSRAAQQLLHSLDGNTRSDRAIALLNGQIQQTAQLINDLHGLSGLTRKDLLIKRERLDICALVSRAAARSAERLARNGQALTLAIPAGPAHLEGDAPRLEQVVETLIEKAALFASPGGRIWLTAKLLGTAAREPIARGGQPMPQIIVVLRDDGAGNVKAVLPRVFNLMNPADRPLDASDSSFEAGLKMMRRIVELHGGAVCAVSSGLGQGSEFELRLPLEGGAAATLAPERRSS